MTLTNLAVKRRALRIPPAEELPETLPGDPADAVPWRERELLPLKTAGEICGFAPVTFHTLRREGLVELVNLRGRTFITPKEVLRLIDARRAWKTSARVGFR
jgi:hypothetical protein